MTDDRGLAELAAALHLVYCRGNAPMHSAPDHSAAAILGERGVFLPDGLATLEGHRVCEENMDAEIARLRADSLDAAWAEAEAALPEGWPNSDLGVRRLPDGTGYAWASGYLGEPPAYIEIWYPGEEAASPAAALRALAAKLREMAG
jgi:hypothetical protein